MRKIYAAALCYSHTVFLFFAFSSIADLFKNQFGTLKTKDIHHKDNYLDRVLSGK